MFFFDFCEIFKNTYFHKALHETTSGSLGRYLKAYTTGIILKTSKLHYWDNSGETLVPKLNIFLSIKITSEAVI